MQKTHGLWAMTAPAAPTTAALNGERSVQIAVIGGGYTGLSAALHLAEAGRSVAVLEETDIGFGGSGRNVGLVNAGMWTLPDDLPGTLGQVHGDRLLTTLGNAPQVVFDLIAKHNIPCEAQHNGTLHCAVGRSGLAELETRAAQWKARGAPVQLLSADDAATMIGSRAYTGALLDLRAGTVQPLAYARGLARAAQTAGAEIFTKTPVTSVDRDGTGWRVTTPTGTVRAEWVVVATNAYTHAPWPQLRAEVAHLPYFNFATKPLAPDVLKTVLPGLQGCWDTRQVLSSFRMDAAGRLVFGSVGALQGLGTSVHEAWVRRAIARVFPQIGPVEFDAKWFGSIGLTDTSLPRLHVLAPQVVCFNGYNGRGIAPGTVFGRCLADLITGKTDLAGLPLPVTEPKAQSMRALNEAYYEYGAQAAHLVGARLF